MNIFHLRNRLAKESWVLAYQFLHILPKVINRRVGAILSKALILSVGELEHLFIVIGPIEGCLTAVASLS